MPRITTKCFIEDHELVFDTSRSGGPGGQNVNKVETRVSIEFDLARSPSLSDGQRTLLMKRLASRLTEDGRLRLSCQETRSQAKNREIVVQRFVEVIAEALKVEKKRVATKATRSSQRRRVNDKKARGQTKRDRRGGGWD